MTRIDENKY